MKLPLIPACTFTVLLTKRAQNRPPIVGDPSGLIPQNTPPATNTPAAPATPVPSTPHKPQVPVTPKVHTPPEPAEAPHVYALGDGWQLPGADLTETPDWFQSGWRDYVVPGLAQRNFGPRPALTDFNLGPDSPLRPTIANWTSPMAGTNYAEMAAQSGGLLQALQAISAAQTASSQLGQNIPQLPTMPGPYSEYQ